MSATTNSMRSNAWLVLLWLVASCGLNFDRYEPTGSVDGSVEDASDGGSSVVEDATFIESGGAPDGRAAQDAGPSQEASFGCTTSGTCQGSAPVCNPATHQCVQCLSTSDCRAPAPYCNAQSFTCATGCTSDTECPGATPYCNPTSAACVQCVTSTNCAGTSSPICSMNQCVQCQSNTNCSGGTPYCNAPDGGAGTCVQCLLSNQCPFRTPTCTGGRCR